MTTFHSTATPGLKVEVYRNTRSDCWSIRHQGKVIDRALHVTLREPVQVIPSTGKPFIRGTLYTNYKPNPEAGWVKLEGELPQADFAIFLVTSEIYYWSIENAALS